MTITNYPKVHTVAPPTSTARTYPAGGRRFDLVVALLSLWMIIGLYLDGSAHHHIPELIETFITPWHAVLYSGFLLATGFLFFQQQRNIACGHAWLFALPKGYLLSVPGMVIFGLSGVGDFVWHTLFGFEVGLEALVSPTHLTLAVGGFLMVSGPLRASIERLKQHNQRGWADLFPVALSLLTVSSILTFFTGEFSILSYPHMMVDRPSVEATFFHDIHGLASVITPSIILVGTILYAIRHWRMPRGSLLFIIVGNGLLLTFFHLKEVLFYPQVLLALVGTGVMADIFYWRFRPSFSNITMLRVMAFMLPVVLFSLYFTILLVTAGLWWSVHLWTGSILMGGVAGFLLSYLMTTAIHHHANDLNTTTQQ